MKKYFLILIVLSFFAGIRFALGAGNSPSFAIPGSQVKFTHVLLDEPRVRYGQATFRANNLTVYVPSEVRIGYGDMVDVVGTIEERQFISRQSNQVIRQLVIEDAVLTVREIPGLYLVGVLRKHIIEGVERSLSTRESGLLVGIIFGVKDRLSHDLYAQFQKTGTLHIIAASGANVSIVASALLGVLVLFLQRRIALVICIAGIFFYALLANFEASIVRAAIMASVALGAGIAGRQSMAVFNLILTGLIMILFHPFIVMDKGFQLSFTATAGILTVKPIFDHMLSGTIVQGVLSDLTTTVAAQIATIPILLSAFGSYSYASILVNLLVLWTVPPLMIVGGIGSFIAVLIPPIGQLFLFLTYPLLSYFLWIVDLFSRWSPEAEGVMFPWYWVAAYYCFLAAGIMIFRQKYHEN